ncbi:uncharacterized protein BKA55DRAFT_682428 [Fusarium redolens]|uniref:Uncharacterized protein n=1 Tax=Fusarium redolens TaxID=48865 RepID=A0A9P9KVK2_FUSRE|nr:uncharacterized protein BKA55DRAFT_682428 [Fusarium redolens]KAH7269339.1 hypothetical protein BKA55DRAFT_682428 [Fusarium redolens]
MDRSRRMPQRRRPLGASASPTSTSEASFDLNPLTSPVVSHTNTTTPQGVGGRRSAKPLQHAFTFSSPSSSRNSNAKKRSTTMDNYPIPDEGEHGPKKGGHSLRKRARVDYTFEHIDDDVVVPNSTSSARGKKRRSEVNFDTDDFYSNDSKRRGASMGADTPSNRRRNPSRKSSDLKVYHQAALQEDDNDVQDTIEVGAYYSDVDDSELRDAASNNSSPQNKMPSKDSPKKSPQNESTKDAFAAPQVGENQQQLETKETLSAPQAEQISSDKVSSVVEPTRTSIEEPVSQATEPQTEKLPKVEPEPESLSTTQKSPAAEDVNEVKPPAVAVADAQSEPAATAVPDSNPVEVEPEVEAEAVAAPVSEPVPAPSIEPLPITADENNKSESVHSPIVPASEPESVPVNGVAEVPTTEPLPQDPSEPGLSLTNTNTNTNTDTDTNIKEETSHLITNIYQFPKSTDQLHQDDKMNAMDKMEIDPVQDEHPTQDVEMTDAAPLDSQELVQEPVQESVQEPARKPAQEPMELTQEPEQLSQMPEQEPAEEPTTAHLPPAASSPSALRARSASPPKSPSKPLSPSPAREIEEPRQSVENVASPQNVTSNDVPTPVEVNGDSTKDEKVDNETVENNKDKESAQVPATADELPIPDSPAIPLTQEEPATISSPTELKAPTPPPTETIETPASSAPSDTKASPQKPVAPRIAMESMPQPTPVGRWSHLKPYVDGEFTLYPEKKRRSDEDGTNDDTTPEGKDTDMEPMVDDQDDIVDGGGLEAPTPALNTPTRGSPVADSTDPTAFNSPAPGGDDGDDPDVSESQEVPGRTRYYKYRKLRDPEEYISILENYEDMSTEDLYELLEAVNVSMVQWQDEWTELGAVVDDYENSLRRRAADAKYEARTRNLNQHGLNYEEPEFAVKGYKSRDKEGLNETRYLQGQDRIMAAAYGFEYDPHPSKIGKQNPETQQVGIMTRGRSLRNQPRQTAKATETDEVVGKRQRKPVQLFDPATQDVSRSSTPVPPTRGGRRRKNANAEDEPQTSLSVSFNTEAASENEASGPKTRRKRGTRGKNAATTEEPAPTPDAEEPVQESPAKSTRRGRARPAVKYEEADPNEFVDDEPQEEEEEVQEKEEKPPVRRALVTLKLPRAYYNDVTPENEITDNGESRPTTASSEASGHTVESSYSFRPKRQKRFRDDPNDAEELAQAPPKKKGKRTSGGTTTTEVPSNASTPAPSVEPAQAPNNRKIQKIKVVRSGQDAKNGGTPAPQAPPPAAAIPTTGPPSAPPSVAGEDGDDTPKDYKSMTKSEKMSASMKNRWANGNMAGAVEKRKATLAAKKAAQAAAEQRTGVAAPNKPKGKATVKRDSSSLKMQMQPDQPQMPPQQPPMLHQPPPMHPHQHELPPHQYHPHQHQHQHPPHPLHLQQQPPMHPAHPQHLPPPPPPPPHQAGNPPPPFMHGHPQHRSHGHSHGMPGMGYPY